MWHYIYSSKGFFAVYVHPFERKSDTVREKKKEAEGDKVERRKMRREIAFICGSLFNQPENLGSVWLKLGVLNCIWNPTFPGGGASIVLSSAASLDEEQETRMEVEGEGFELAVWRGM